VGSVFRVELPVELSAESQVIRPASDAGAIVSLASGQPEYRIVVADNDDGSRNLLERLLLDAGFQVRAVENGARALELFTSWRPHWIWMDLNMPVMTGREAAMRIRELEGGAEVRIAAVTASAFGLMRADALSQSMDDFVPKPYRPADIFDCMSRHLGVRYAYEQPVSSGDDSPEREFSTEELSSLPSEVRADLQSAVVSLDPERITRAIQQLREQHPSAAAALQQLAKHLKYSAILKVLQPESKQAPKDDPVQG
jgi:CheY-like chemotaxis protein